MSELELPQRLLEEGEIKQFAAWLASMYEQRKSILYTWVWKGACRCTCKPLVCITVLIVLYFALLLTTIIKKFDHITPALKELHWLPVEQRIKFKILCLTFKALNGPAPDYIADLIKHYSPTQTLHSADQMLLCVPKVHTKKFSEWTFSFAAPTLYNGLPLKLRQSPSLDSFKSNLKPTCLNSPITSHKYHWSKCS